MIEWWSNREENEVAWKVKVEELKSGFDLDVKNPHREQVEKELSVTDLLSRLKRSLDQSRALLEELERQIS